jgi:hypothetical protein
VHLPIVVVRVKVHLQLGRKGETVEVFERAHATPILPLVVAIVAAIIANVAHGSNGATEEDRGSGHESKKDRRLVCCFDKVSTEDENDTMTMMMGDDEDGDGEEEVAIFTTSSGLTSQQVVRCSACTCIHIKLVRPHADTTVAAGGCCGTRCD